MPKSQLFCFFFSYFFSLFFWGGERGGWKLCMICAQSQRTKCEDCRAWGTFLHIFWMQLSFLTTLQSVLPTSHRHSPRFDHWKEHGLSSNQTSPYPLPVIVQSQIHEAEWCWILTVLVMWDLGSWYPCFWKVKPAVIFSQIGSVIFILNQISGLDCNVGAPPFCMLAYYCTGRSYRTKIML